jgi:hypothetical protein
MSNEEVIQDFRRRYESTYVFLNMEDKGIETLAYVSQVETSSSKMGVLHLTSETYGALTINIGSDNHSLSFKYPKMGVFQHGRDAFLFHRRPARQYRRGICADNSTIWNVTRNFAGNISRWNAREVQAAYDHKVYSVSEALKLLESGAVRSAALPNNFSISHTVFDSPEHVIWYWQYPVARCSAKGKITLIYEDVFKTQLEGMFNHE